MAQSSQTDGFLLFQGFLYVGKLDGSVSTALIKEGLHKPRGIAVDSEQRYNKKQD